MSFVRRYWVSIVVAALFLAAALITAWLTVGPYLVLVVACHVTYCDL